MSFVLPQSATRCGKEEYLDRLIVGTSSSPVPPPPSPRSLSFTSLSETTRSSSETTSNSSNNSSSESSLEDPSSVALKELLQQATISIHDDATFIETVSSAMAFCNSVYRVQVPTVTAATTAACDIGTRTTSSTIYFAKIFSSLALSRMTLPLGVLDQFVARHSLAPPVVAQTASGILYENCPGRILTEADCHSRANEEECRMVARALKELHSLQPHYSIDGALDNVLWKACDSMLQLCHESYECQGWTLAKLNAIVQQERSQLESLQLPMVVCGHGDCKPANIILLQDDTITQSQSQSSTQVRFIDLELAGVHYRAFDLAKFFRTDSPTEFTKQNQRAFYQAYLETATTTTTTAATSSSEQMTVTTTLDDLEREVKLLVPMTWLEAAIFFVCMACQDEVQASRWNQLAMDRLMSYQKSVSERALLGE
jgi:thiamine kinase-like enzyme